MYIYIRINTIRIPFSMIIGYRLITFVLNNNIIANGLYCIVDSRFGIPERNYVCKIHTYILNYTYVSTKSPSTGVGMADPVCKTIFFIEKYWPPGSRRKRIHLSRALPSLPPKTWATALFIIFCPETFSLTLFCWARRDDRWFFMPQRVTAHSGGRDENINLYKGVRIEPHTYNCILLY